MKTFVRVLVAAGLAGTGCWYTFDPEGLGCADGGLCPEGFRCGVDGLCHFAADGGVVDGGRRDAGAADAGPVDAGPPVCMDCSKAECAGKLCRAAAGPCDVDEVCTAGVCPADRLADAGVVCSAATCSGSSTVPARVCDGLGLCRAVDGGRDCSPFACAVDAGRCVTNCSAGGGCADGYYCSGTSCAAQLDDGIACSAGDWCQSGHCVDGVCCNAACDGGCGACALTGSVGTCGVQPTGAATARCAEYLCSGTGETCPTVCTGDEDCASTHYCNSATPRKCVVKKALGTACSSGGQCDSGNCVDGACCNSACAGGCDVCNAPGSVGLCVVVDAGTPGAAPACAPYVCGGSSAACPTSCATDAGCAPGAPCIAGLCNGKLGAGQPCGADSVCDSNHCVDGLCCDTTCGSACDRCNLPGNAGVCTIDYGASDAGCGGYRCGVTATCPTSCSASDECAPGFYCNGTCVPAQSNGATCFSDLDCASGHCVEGVCCNNSCTGGCRTCLQALGAPANGTCGSVLEHTDPRSACGDYFCGDAGACATSTPCNSKCEDVCKSGLFCNGAQCVARSGDGTACLDSCECFSACRLFYRDADGDGYGATGMMGMSSMFCGASPPMSFSATDDDCCDTDLRAYPGQSAYFNSPRQQCGGFDFDCDTVATKQYPTSGGTCESEPVGLCDDPCRYSTTTPGWATFVPSCGDAGTFYTGTCTTTMQTYAQCPSMQETFCLTEENQVMLQSCR